MLKCLNTLKKATNMTIYKFLPKDNFTKFDNKIFSIDRNILCDGAKVLYGFLASMRTGAKITDNYILKSLALAPGTLKKYKKQLKDLDLIIVDRIGSRHYDIYIGNTRVKASVVKQFWNIKDSGKQIALEELAEMQIKTKLEIDEIEF